MLLPRSSLKTSLLGPPMVGTSLKMGFHIIFIFHIIISFRVSTLVSHAAASGIDLLALTI